MTTNKQTGNQTGNQTKRRAHYHVAQSAVEIVSQRAKTEDKKRLPLKVIKEMMRAETRASTTSPRIMCHRCYDHLLQKFMILVEQQWPKEPVYVCRLCYNKKRDHKAYKTSTRR